MTTAAGPPLVTGASGFAGSHLVERLLLGHDAVVAWANANSASPRSPDPRVRWQAVDLTDPPSVAAALAGLRPSAIYHLAGLPHVGESWTQSGRALHVNAYGTHVLLHAISRAGLDCPIVVTGSAQVYRPSDDALSEDHAIGPSNPYGVSKLAQEMVALESGARVIIARPFNHAWPRQPASFVASSFAQQIARIEQGLSEPVLHVGNLDARRDLTDVRDTVRAYELLAQRGVPGRPYNVCSGKAYQVREVLDSLLGMATVPVRIEQDPERLRPSDTPLIVGDPARLEQETGWRAEIPLSVTLRDTLNWWRTQ